MAIGLLTLHLHLPGCVSLKEKRSRIKPILARLHREFNLSVAETALQDAWQETVISCSVVNSDRIVVEKTLQQVAHYIEITWPDEPVIDQQLEII